MSATFALKRTDALFFGELGCISNEKERTVKIVQQNTAEWYKLTLEVSAGRVGEQQMVVPVVSASVSASVPHRALLGIRLFVCVYECVRSS